MRLKPNSLFQIVVSGKALNQKRKLNQIERSTKCQRFRLYIYIYRLSMFEFEFKLDLLER